MLPQAEYASNMGQRVTRVNEKYGQVIDMYRHDMELIQMQLARLYITSPSGLARTVDLAGAATLGRDVDNDIVLEEVTLSRCHALLLAGPHGSLLYDLDSTNGTLVNGTLVPPDRPVPLADGDLIALGRVLARYHAGADRHQRTQGADDGTSTS